MITQPAHQLHRQGQKLQGLDNRSLRLIARPMALTNATLADACHVPHHSLVSYCCHPDHFPLIYQLYMPFCPVFSLCRVSFLDGPSAKRVAAWDGGTVLALSWASRGRSTLVLSEQNQTKSFFFFFFFWQGGRLLSCMTYQRDYLYQSSCWDNLCRLWIVSSLLWLCSIWSLVSETVLKCLCLITVPGWEYWGTRNQHPDALGAEWS